MCIRDRTEDDDSDGVISVVANELEAQLIAANFDSSLATAVKNGAIEASS